MALWLNAYHKHTYIQQSKAQPKRKKIKNIKLYLKNTLSLIPKEKKFCERKLHWQYTSTLGRSDWLSFSFQVSAHHTPHTMVSFSCIYLSIILNQSFNYLFCWYFCLKIYLTFCVDDKFRWNWFVMIFIFIRQTLVSFELCVFEEYDRRNRCHIHD